jgi:hypothetical protein
MACGKTRHAEKLRQHFGLRHIRDGWSPGDPVAADTLMLTAADEVHVSATRRGARVVSFARAMEQIDG